MSPESAPHSSKWKSVFTLRVAAILVVAILLGLQLWPSDSEPNPYELSRADGKSRFYVTKYPTRYAPQNLTFLQRVSWEWRDFKERHSKRNPAVWTFPPSPLQPCSIGGLLNQCMDTSGTRYMIGVEIAGVFEFGHTNSLTGSQWVAAVEHALETSKSVVCYDYTKKRNFQDTLLLIRESPGIVKVVPRSKLAEYQKIGLVR